MDANVKRCDLEPDMDVIRAHVKNFMRGYYDPADEVQAKIMDMIRELVGAGDDRSTLRAAVLCEAMKPFIADDQCVYVIYGQGMTGIHGWAVDHVRNDHPAEDTVELSRRNLGPRS